MNQWLQFWSVSCSEKGEEGKGGIGNAPPPPQKKYLGGGRHFFAFYIEKFPNFYLLRWRGITENLFFRYFIGLIIRKFIPRSNINSHKKLRFYIVSFLIRSA